MSLALCTLSTGVCPVPSSPSPPPPPPPKPSVPLQLQLLLWLKPSMKPQQSTPCYLQTPNINGSYLKSVWEADLNPSFTEWSNILKNYKENGSRKIRSRLVQVNSHSRLHRLKLRDSIKCELLWGGALINSSIIFGPSPIFWSNWSAVKADRAHTSFSLGRKFKVTGWKVITVPVAWRWTHIYA